MVMKSVVTTKSNSVWIRFRTRDDHDSWVQLRERIYAAGFDRPDPMSFHNGGIMLPLPLEVGSPDQAYERYEELFMGFRVETKPPDHLAELRGRAPTDSFEAFVYNGNLDPRRATTLRLFAHAMDKVAQKHARIRKMSFADRAEMIDGHWHVGDQGFLAEFGIHPRQVQPSYWLLVDDTEEIQSRLWKAEPEREWVTVRGQGILVAFEGKRPTIKDAAAIRAIVNPPTRGSTRANAQSRYWIEVETTDTDPENVVTRVSAGGIDRKSDTLYALNVPITPDPRTEAARVERVIRGEEQAVALPREIEELLGGDIPEGNDQSYPLGARAAYTRVLRLVDVIKYETYRLAQLYILQIARVQEELGFEMKGRDTVKWLVDNWQLGDKGCSAKLAEEFSSPPQRRRKKRTSRKRSQKRAVSTQALRGVSRGILSRSFARRSSAWKDDCPKAQTSGQPRFADFTNKPLGGSECYWVEVRDFSHRDITAMLGRLSGLETTTQYICYSSEEESETAVLLVRVPISLDRLCKDTASVGVQANKIMAGMAAWGPVPEILFELATQTIPRDPSTDTDWVRRLTYPDVASRDIELALLTHEAELDLDVLQGIQLYLRELAHVESLNKERSGERYDGQEMVKYIIENWHLGFLGAAHHLWEHGLVLTGNGPVKLPTAREMAGQKHLTWVSQPPRRGVVAEASTLADGSKVTIVRSMQTGVTTLFHNSRPIATGSTESLKARAQTMARRAQ